MERAQVAGTGARVTVGIPTYRRPEHLWRCLAAVMPQAQAINLNPHGRFEVDILVVDNDPESDGLSAVARDHGPVVRCVVEAQPGIAAVRNRCLDECAAAQALVFIDDDEVPHEGWLDALLETWQVSGAAIVSGRVVAEFEAEPDPWLEAGRFFVRRNLATGDNLDVAAAGNLLVDLAQVRRLGVRFSEEFGLTGGEDNLFSRQVSKAGGRLVWCAESVVTDVVPESRMSRKWVLTRALSHGNTTALISQRLAPTSLRRALVRIQAALKGSANIAVGLARFAIGVAASSFTHQARGMRSVARGVGLAAGSMGLAYYEYRRTGAKFSRPRLQGSLRQNGHGCAASMTVLQSFPQPRTTTNPYLIMLRDSLLAQPGIDVLTFKWRRSLFAHYDVVHLHWPEILVTGATPAKQMLKQICFALWLLRLRLTGTPIVRTKHNLYLPDGISAVQRLLLRTAERQTSMWIRLNPTTPVPADVPHTTILHGHYQDWFSSFPAPCAIPGRIGYAGLIRRYKGVEALIGAFQRLNPDDGTLSLCVAGRPTSPTLHKEIERLARADSRISLELRFLSDQDLVKVIGESELIVLPYRLMHNSGSALACLSLGRPILVPDSEVNRLLRDEVGSAWVYCFEGELKTSDLELTLKQVRAKSWDAGPRLGNRHWHDAGAAHVEAYRRAISRLRDS